VTDADRRQLMTTPLPEPTATDAGDLTAPREDNRDAALRSTRASVDRLALDRLEFDIRAWWARNRRLHDQVLLERDGRRDERGLGLPRRRVRSKE
jgi:hypothetical protein